MGTHSLEDIFPKFLAKSYFLLNLIPLGLFYFLDIVFNIGISPIRPITPIILLILDIIIAQSMKDYLLSSIILWLSCVAGVIIHTTWYYYNVSSDFETPVVGAFIACVYAVGMIILTALGAIPVYFKVKKNKNSPQSSHSE